MKVVAQSIRAARVAAATCDSVLLEEEAAIARRRENLRRWAIAHGYEQEIS